MERKIEYKVMVLVGTNWIEHGRFTDERKSRFCASDWFLAGYQSEIEETEERIYCPIGDRE